MRSRTANIQRLFIADVKTNKKWCVCKLFFKSFVSETMKNPTTLYDIFYWTCIETWLSGVLFLNKSCAPFRLNKIPTFVGYIMKFGSIFSSNLWNFYFFFVKRSLFLFAFDMCKDLWKFQREMWWLNKINGL